VGNVGVLAPVVRGSGCGLEKRDVLESMNDVDVTQRSLIASVWLRPSSWINGREIQNTQQSTNHQIEMADAIAAVAVAHEGGAGCWKMKKAELQSKLTEMGLNATGVRPVLRARLAAALAWYNRVYVTPDKKGRRAATEGEDGGGGEAEVHVAAMGARDGEGSPAADEDGGGGCGGGDAEPVDVVEAHSHCRPTRTVSLGGADPLDDGTVLLLCRDGVKVALPLELARQSHTVLNDYEDCEPCDGW
jgi:hypothetical protein